MPISLQIYSLHFKKPILHPTNLYITECHYYTKQGISQPDIPIRWKQQILINTMTDVLSELHHQIDECSIVEIKLFVKRLERFEGIK